MGRDDVAVGVGGEGGMLEDGTILPNVGGYLPLIEQAWTTRSLSYTDFINWEIISVWTVWYVTFSYYQIELLVLHKWLNGYVFNQIDNLKT